MLQSARNHVRVSACWGVCSFLFLFLVLGTPAFAQEGWDSSPFQSPSAFGPETTTSHGGPYVGFKKCVNGGDNFGPVEPPVFPANVTVIECVVPYGYNAKRDFLQIHYTLNEECANGTLGTTVQVGGVLAYPEPNGQTSIDCSFLGNDGGFSAVNISRNFFLFPDRNLSVKAGDTIAVLATRAPSGTPSIGLVRAIMVDVVKDVVIHKKQKKHKK